MLQTLSPRVSYLFGLSSIFVTSSCVFQAYSVFFPFPWLTNIAITFECVGVFLICLLTVLWLQLLHSRRISNNGPWFEENESVVFVYWICVLLYFLATLLWDVSSFSSRWKNPSDWNLSQHLLPSYFLLVALTGAINSSFITTETLLYLTSLKLFLVALLEKKLTRVSDL